MSSVHAKPRKRPRPPTLKDVARALKVSPATISNAYHHPERLSAALRARVVETADRLGYHPDPTARGLRMRTTRTVGVMYTDALPWAFTDPPFTTFLKGVAEVTQEAGLTLLLASGAVPSGPDLDPVRGAAVDGFIFYAPASHDPRVVQVLRRGLPAVLVDAQPVADLPVVGIDDVAGAAALAEHLFTLGHRRLAVLSMPLRPGHPSGVAPMEPPPHSDFLAIEERLAGFAAAARRRGLSWADVASLHVSHVNDVQHGRLAARAALAGPRPPTALVCLSDQLALGALTAARELGLEVPRQLSVVGYDDIPEAARTTPPLTTVHQSHDDKGRVTARLLLDLLGGKHASSIRLPTRLVVRGSCGPPAPARRGARGR